MIMKKYIISGIFVAVVFFTSLTNTTTAAVYAKVCPANRSWRGSVCIPVFQQNNHYQDCLQIANAQWLGNDVCKCVFGYEMVPLAQAATYGGNSYYQFSCYPSGIVPPTPVPSTTYCEVNKEYTFSVSPYIKQCTCPSWSTMVDNKQPNDWQSLLGTHRFTCVSTYTPTPVPQYPTYKTCPDGSVIMSNAMCLNTQQHQCAYNQIWNGYSCSYTNNNNWIFNQSWDNGYSSYNYSQYNYNDMPVMYDWNDYQNGYSY